jgi:uncharacterized protein YgiM (DUF1202 family)
LLNLDELAAAYQEFARTAENVPGLARLSYLLGVRFIELQDTKNAALILGVPAVRGFGIVETQRTRLNIRSGEGTNYRIVTKADKGEQVILLGKSDQWYHVLLQNGTIGYAHSDFIKESQQ